MEFRGSSALITGAGSGIGAASARAFAAIGAQVVCFDRDGDAARRVAAEVGGVAVEGDVANESDAQNAVDAAMALAPLRVLVNSAGLGPPQRVLDRERNPMPLRAFEFVLRVNLIGTFNCVRLAAAAMAANEPGDADGARGVIINLASVAAFDGQIGQAAYSASKAGVAGMTLPLARDLATVGIRVNTIAPGLVDTPIYDVMPDPEQFKARLGEGVVFPKRLGVADEIAAMAVAIATNDYVNGETIRVDGAIRLPPR